MTGQRPQGCHARCRKAWDCSLDCSRFVRGSHEPTRRSPVRPGFDGECSRVLPMGRFRSRSGARRWLNQSIYSAAADSRVSIQEPKSSGVEQRSDDVLGQATQAQSSTTQVLQRSADRRSRPIESAWPVEVPQDVDCPAIQSPYQLLHRDHLGEAHR